MGKEPGASFNPLDKNNLGRSVAEALLALPRVPLGEIKDFTGAGIYAIYYGGNHKAYSRIALSEQRGKSEIPIYVGKAVPAGSRKGNYGLIADPGKVLFKRLNEHAESIDQTPGLRLSDFHCRFLVVDDIWIPLGEALLIAKSSPVWNKLLDGFGNHDPGSGRYNQLRSRWDTLHPGRPWAKRCKARGETADQLTKEIQNYLNIVIG